MSLCLKRSANNAENSFHLITVFSWHTYPLYFLTDYECHWSFHCVGVRKGKLGDGLGPTEKQIDHGEMEKEK